MYPSFNGWRIFSTEYWKHWHNSSVPSGWDEGEPMPFDGARHFGQVAIVIGVATLISAPAVGCWGALGAAVALYYLLSFFNALEIRDLVDEDRKQRERRPGR
jgi:hypothetical protein